MPPISQSTNMLVSESGREMPIVSQCNIIGEGPSTGLNIMSPIFQSTNMMGNSEKRNIDSTDLPFLNSNNCTPVLLQHNTTAGMKSRSNPTPRTRRRLQHYRKTIHTVRSRLFRANSRLHAFQFKSVKKSNKENINEIENIIKKASKYLPRNTLNMFATQMRISRQNKYNRRWHSNDKKFALNLYFHSPHAYRVMRHTFTLPTVRSLQNWLKSIPLNPGLSTEVIMKLKKCVPNMKENDKLCCLIFDEMKLKCNLTYNRRTDIIYGYEDFGDVRSSRVADQAFVLMIKGITTNWKQPIGYLLSHKCTPSDVIKKYVMEAIQTMTDVGLCIKAVICDQGACNLSLYRKLGVTIEKPYINFNGGKIFFMHDVPHLMKCLRNNLCKYNLNFKNHEVKWSYIHDFFRRDSLQKIRAATKLTEAHIMVPSSIKMKVKYATQIFSYSVACGLYTHVSLGTLPAEAAYTLELIEMMDRLFDTFNSLNLYDIKHYKRGITPTSSHIQFLRELFDVMQNSKFNAPRQPPCMSGWKLSIKAVIGLWEDLQSNSNVKFLLTRRLNQDALENLFCLIRQKRGNSRFPTVEQFETAFKHILVNSLMKASGKNSNCEADDDYILQEILTYSKSGCSIERCTNESNIFTPSIIEDISIDSDLLNENSYYYVSGYIVKYFLQRHNCSHCEQLLTDPSTIMTLPQQILTHYKAFDESEYSDFGHLTKPSQAMFTFYIKCDAIIEKLYPSYAHKKDVRKNLLQIVLKDNSFQLCTEESTTDFISNYSIVKNLLEN